MLWPDDRAWFVATEVDASSTYVGGSSAGVDALLSHPALGATSADVDAPCSDRRAAL